MPFSALPLMSANSFFGMVVETTYGASVSPTILTPINSPKVTPGVTFLDDSDFRGSPVMHYDQVPGVAKATYSGKTFTYTDVFPNLLRSALGSVDAVASVGPSLWTHTIGLQQQPNTGSQAPSYSLWNDSVDATYLMTASRLSTLGVSFAADAAVENTFEFITNLPVQLPTSASVSSSPSSIQHLIPAWNCAASLGGVASTVVEQVSLDIKRNTAPIFTLGSQSAASNFQGPLEVSGKINLIVQQGETYWANSLVRFQQQIILNLVDPVTGYGILFQMSACQIENAMIDQSKNFVAIEADFTAVANTTDCIVPNTYSPIKTVSTNNVSAAY